MNAAGHYRAAEKHLEVLEMDKDSAEWVSALNGGRIAVAMEAAHVHACLALAREVAGLRAIVADQWNGGRK